MPRRTPKSLPHKNTKDLSPEERLLAHQAFRCEVGVRRAWDDVKRDSARAADPRTWIRRRPIATVLSTGALSALFMMRRSRPPSTGILAGLASAGFLLLRRAAITSFINRVLSRFTQEKMPDLFGECETQFPVTTRRRRRYPSAARWN